MPKGNPGEMLGACACAAPQLKSAAASAIAKRITMASALFSPSVRARPAQPASPCNRAGRTSLCLDCRDLLDPAAAPHLGRAFQRPGADRLSGSSCACVYRLVARAQRSHWLAGHDDCRAAHLRETDCVAGHVRFELRNVVANYPFENSWRFAGNQPNSGQGGHSGLGCNAGDTQLGPAASIPRAGTESAASPALVKCHGDRSGGCRRCDKSRQTPAGRGAYAKNDFVKSVD